MKPIQNLEIIGINFKILNLLLYLSKSFSIYFAESESFKNKLNPLPFRITGRPNITISLTLSEALCCSSATSTLLKQAELQILVCLIIRIHLVTSKTDAALKYTQPTPVIKPSTSLALHFK